MSIKISLAAALTAGIAAPAVSQEMNLGIGVSSLGPEMRLTYAMSDMVKLRGFYTLGLTQSSSQTIDQINYSVDVQTGALGAMVDYHPWAGGLRMSGGLVRSNLEFNFGANITSPTLVGDKEYSSGSIHGTLDFDRKISPLLSIGYDLSLGARWVLTSEIGAVLNNGFAVSGKATGPISQSDLNKELTTIENDLSGINFYPYLAFGLNYQF